MQPDLPRFPKYPKSTKQQLIYPIQAFINFDFLYLNPDIIQQALNQKEIKNLYQSINEIIKYPAKALSKKIFLGSFLIFLICASMFLAILKQAKQDEEKPEINSLVLIGLLQIIPFGILCTIIFFIRMKKIAKEMRSFLEKWNKDYAKRLLVIEYDTRGWISIDLTQIHKEKELQEQSRQQESELFSIDDEDDEMDDSNEDEQEEKVEGDKRDDQVDLNTTNSQQEETKDETEITIPGFGNPKNIIDKDETTVIFKYDPQSKKYSMKDFDIGSIDGKISSNLISEFFEKIRSELQKAETKQNRIGCVCILGVFFVYTLFASLVYKLQTSSPFWFGLGFFVTSCVMSVVINHSLKKSMNLSPPAVIWRVIKKEEKAFLSQGLHWFVSPRNAWWIELCLDYKYYRPQTLENLKKDLFDHDEIEEEGADIFDHFSDRLALLY